jgi:DNA-binding NtrC family response regulator
MKKIVVVERNPHIRSLVQRELISEGYTVFAPACEKELLDLFSGRQTVDLMIIDPEVLDNNFGHIAEKISVYRPDLPVIVHALAVDKDGVVPFGSVLERIEKNWDSISELKKVTADAMNAGGHAR